MAEWIGELIGSWPVWAIVAVLIVISFVWVYYYTHGIDGWPFNKKEWWQDKEKRLAQKAKHNAKKG